MNDFLTFSVNFVALIIVISVIFFELSNLLSFLFLRSWEEKNYITRVQNKSSRIYYMLFYISVAFIGYVYFFASIDNLYFIALVALAVGFFVNIWLYQVCVINEEGIGGIRSNYTAEIGWESISGYTWNKDKLTLQYRNKVKRRRSLRFFDSRAVKLTKAYLSEKVDSQSGVES